MMTTITMTMMIDDVVMMVIVMVKNDGDCDERAEVPRCLQGSMMLSAVIS